MEKIITDEYAVHFDVKSDNWVQFIVYPIVGFTEGEVEGFKYCNIEDGQDYIDFEESKCFVKMKGSYVWRGLWEGRVYMVDSEYWSEDLVALANLFTEHIEPACQNYLRSVNKNIYE